MTVSSRSRDVFALMFLGVSVLSLTAIVFKSRERLLTGENLVVSRRLPSRFYTHHARQLTSTEIDDVIQENPSFSDYIRSLVEIEVERMKSNQSFMESRNFTGVSQREEPITEEPTLLIDKRVSEELRAKVRILCWVPSMAIHWNTKLRAVNETWARRCDKVLYFISSPKNKSDDVVALDIPDKRQTLTDKTVFVHKFLYKHYLTQFDWFLKADDDTYVIVENLRFLLTHFDPEVPAYIGCQFKHFSPQGYMSGGAGYLFNRQGLQNLVEKGYNIPARCRLKGGAEDIETGRCAYKAGVRTLNSLDVYKRPTFFPSNVFATMMGLPDWAKNYMRDHVSSGKNCCSQLMVAFHYTGPKLMYAIDFLLYRVNVHGRRFMIEKAEKVFDGTEAEDMDRKLRRRPYPGEDLNQYYTEGWRELNTTIYINPNLV